MPVKIWILYHSNGAGRVGKQIVCHASQYYPGYEKEIISNAGQKTKEHEQEKRLFTQIERETGKGREMGNDLRMELNPLLPITIESSFKSSTAWQSFSLASPQYNFQTVIICTKLQVVQYLKKATSKKTMW